PGRIDGAETGVLPDPSVGAPMGPGQREKIGEFEMGPDIRRLARRLLDGEGREVDAHDAFDRAGLRQGTDVVSKAAAGHEDRAREGARMAFHPFQERGRWGSLVPRRLALAITLFPIW